MPGDARESEPHCDGTTELILVLTGIVAVTVATDTIVLHSGDALTFRGDLRHVYRNSDAAPARFALSVYEPGGHP